MPAAPESYNRRAVASPKISEGLQRAISEAFTRATEQRHEFVTLEHLLLALLSDARVAAAIGACGGNVKALRKALNDFLDRELSRLPENVDRKPAPTLGLDRVVRSAAIHATSSEMDEVDGTGVLVQIMKESDSHAAYLLQQEGITSFGLKQYISHGDPAGDEEPFAVDEDEPEANQDPLERFTTALVEEAAEGRIDPLVGRDAEIERCVQVLCRRRKNNPLLVGEPGVGKTAIAEGLARRIHEGSVPEVLKDAQVFALDMGGLLAGTKFRGQFEQRLKGVIKRLQEIDDAILFIDEIHTIVGAGATSGGSMDASNILKPALASGKLRCIGSTTFNEYKSSFDRDRALARRFQKIDVVEPTVEETVEILHGLKERYEEHHQVVYEEDALEAAAKLAAKHIVERLLPDKAIDVIDEAGAAERLKPADKRSKTIDELAIETVVAKMAKVPAENVSSRDRDRLGELEGELKQVIFGQDEAIGQVVSAIKLSRAGLRATDKPIGSFLFSGPTGVGKTELAKQIAKVLGVEFIRFDMSEYSERHSVSRLIGAPPGYVGYDQGGQLTDKVRQNPYSVVVLDEIEKAHPELFNILLQVMDHAKLTDNNGREADFRNVILVMTTNAGAKEMSSKSIGFGQGEHVDLSKAKKAVEKVFAPEFRNRLDAWVLFHELPRQIILRVVDKEVRLLGEVLQEKDIHITLSGAAREWLADHGYEPEFGARPMARLVERKIKKPLAELILFEGLENGGEVEVLVDNDDITLRQK